MTEFLSLTPLVELLKKKFHEEPDHDEECKEEVLEFMHTRESVGVIAEYIRKFPIPWEQYLTLLNLVGRDDKPMPTFDRIVLCGYVGTYMNVHGYDDTLKRIEMTYDPETFSDK